MQGQKEKVWPANSFQTVGKRALWVFWDAVTAQKLHFSNMTLHPFGLLDSNWPRLVNWRQDPTPRLSFPFIFEALRTSGSGQCQTVLEQSLRSVDQGHRVLDETKDNILTSVVIQSQAYEKQPYQPHSHAARQNGATADIRTNKLVLLQPIREPTAPTPLITMTNISFLYIVCFRAGRHGARSLSTSSAVPLDVASFP